MREQENKPQMNTVKTPGGSSIPQENSTDAPVEKLGMKEDGENTGGGPVDINDGGEPGEERQPKEHTGNMTEMGGDAETAATRIPEASEGNSN